MWPSLKFVYLTTAYFVSQEMIVKLTKLMIDCSELKVIPFNVSFLPCNGVIIETEVGIVDVMLTDCTLLLFFYFFSCQKLLIFSDIITSLTWLWPNLIILGRSIHPSTHLQSKFCGAFWVYCYKTQVIYAHVSYLAVKVPSCSCSSNAPSCLNSKTTICVP